jgi:hypothetical protein
LRGAAHGGYTMAHTLLQIGDLSWVLKNRAAKMRRKKFNQKYLRLIPLNMKKY